MPRDLNTRETISAPSAPSDIPVSKCELVEEGTLRRSWIHEAAMMTIAEMPQITIAKRLGKPLEMVMELPRMPEFKAILASLSEEDDTGVAMKLIRGSLTDSVLTLIKLRDDPHVKAETRRGCANDLISRAIGKVPDTVKVMPRSSVMEEMQAMEAQGMSPAEWLDQQIAQTLDQASAFKNSIINKIKSEAPSVAEKPKLPE